MRQGDKQLGAPQVLYKDTKANVEALAGLVGGEIAYATDTGQDGIYSDVLPGWVWGRAGGLAVVTTDATLTGDGTPSNPLSVAVSTIPSDGWIPVTLGSPTRVSNTTFTTTTDLTSTWKKGTKIKYTDTTTKYDYVVGLSAYSGGSMTIEILGDTLSGNPSNIYYSPIEQPAGFPNNFSFTPVYTGFSTDPTQTMIYSMIGNRLWLVTSTTAQGVSNSTAYSHTLPATVNGNVILFAVVVDNGVLINGTAYAVGTTKTIIYYAGAFGVPFTASGTKGGTAALSYLI